MGATYRQREHKSDSLLLLLQEAMARQAPTYAAHIAQIRQQAVEETAGERERLQGQLSRVHAEMKRLQGCSEADRQATKDLMEVEKIQVGGWLPLFAFQNAPVDVLSPPSPLCPFPLPPPPPTASAPLSSTL